MYKSGEKSTQIDYVMCRRRNLKEMCDCKVIVNECITKQLHGGMQNGSYGEKRKKQRKKSQRYNGGN